MSIEIKLRIPDRVYAGLATIADARGVKIADLIADGVQHVITPKTPRRFVHPIPDPQLRAMIRELRLLHRSVGDIAKTLALDPHRVGATVRDLGFETKRGRPRNTTKETAA